MLVSWEDSLISWVTEKCIFTTTPFEVSKFDRSGRKRLWHNSAACPAIDPQCHPLSNILNCCLTDRREGLVPSLSVVHWRWLQCAWRQFSAPFCSTAESAWCMSFLFQILMSVWFVLTTAGLAFTVRTQKARSSVTPDRSVSLASHRTPTATALVRTSQCSSPGKSTLCRNTGRPLTCFTGLVLGSIYTYSRS